MAHHGAPLLGDVAYGGVSSFVMPSGSVKAIDRIALHASWVMVELEGAKKPWKVVAPVAPEMSALWMALGGLSSSWEKALEPLIR
jgi:23S rRNA-/tRNA-specific pseudouridylate synthase